MIDCRPETAALLAQPEPTECRIEWAILGWGTGHGKWHGIEHQAFLEESVALRMDYYGPGTHWIITR
ncbi:MAG: hypothetical protein ACPG61_15975 [Paracoccaceae bacterium]